MTFLALAELAESRDQETGRHLVRIRSYSQILAEELQMLQRPGYEVDDAFLADLYRASPLHDIGKVGVPDAILQKPGKLNDAEIRVMRQHVEFGAATLERAMGRGHAGEFLQMVAGVARFHHERWDGSGYLAGLAGTDIPLAARIVALADVFDALTSRRVYKDSMSVEETCEMIRSDSGAHFDPTVVAAFDAGISRFLEVVAEHAVSIEAASDLSPARLVEVS